jgi:hypothetical protein
VPVCGTGEQTVARRKDRECGRPPGRMFPIQVIGPERLRFSATDLNITLYACASSSADHEK